MASGIWQLYGNLSVGALADVSSRGVIELSGTIDQAYAYNSGGKSAGLFINKTSGAVYAAVGTTALSIGALEIAAGTFFAPAGDLTIGGTYADAETSTADGGSAELHFVSGGAQSLTNQGGIEPSGWFYVGSGTTLTLHSDLNVSATNQSIIVDAGILDRNFYTVTGPVNLQNGGSAVN